MTKTNEYRVLIIGSAGCGKSSMISKSLDLPFEERYLPTYGISSDILNCEISEKDYSFELLDFSGQEHFNSNRRKYYETADSVIIMYSRGSVLSYKTACFYRAEIKCSKNPNLHITLCENKQDIDPYTVNEKIIGKRLKYNNDFDRFIKTTNKSKCDFLRKILKRTVKDLKHR